MKRTLRLISALSAAAVLAAGCAASGPAGVNGPLVIQEQGSFAVGGRAITDPDGKTFHGDHAFVSYQVPVNARKLPLMLWHGAGQSAKTWETTPDGREGFTNLFLRRGFAVYTIDQPRRGRAGRSDEDPRVSELHHIDQPAIYWQHRSIHIPRFVGCEEQACLSNVPDLALLSGG